MLTAWFAGNIMSIAGSGISKLFTALIGSIVISIASTVIGWILPGKD